MKTIETYWEGAKVRIEVYPLWDSVELSIQGLTLNEARELASHLLLAAEELEETQEEKTND